MFGMQVSIRGIEKCFLTFVLSSVAAAPYGMHFTSPAWCLDTYFSESTQGHNGQLPFHSSNKLDRLPPAFITHPISTAQLNGN